MDDFGVSHEFSKAEPYERTVFYVHIKVQIFRFCVVNQLEEASIGKGHKSRCSWHTNKLLPYLEPEGLRDYTTINNPRFHLSLSNSI